MRSSRRTWLAASLSLGLVALASCLAPTLPVPPPASPEVSTPDQDGIVTVKGAAGSAKANAEVTVWNDNLAGVKGFSGSAAGDGSWEIKLPAQSKQKLWIWQTVGFERSSTLEISVP